MAVLSGLDPTAAELDRARAAVLEALPDAEPQTVSDLVTALSVLDPSEDERGQARAAMLDALPDDDLEHGDRLVATLRSISSVEL